jgi:hypothetical protein
VGRFSYHLCPADESINHLFFSCPATIYMGRTVISTLGALSQHALLSASGG